MLRLSNLDWLVLVHTLRQCVTDVCKLNGIWSKFRGIASRSHLKFGWQIPGQITALHGSLAECHGSEDSLLPGRTPGSGALFWVKRGTSRTPSPYQPPRTKARWHPMASLKDRWGDELSTHSGTHARAKICRHVGAWQRSFCQPAFDMTGWQKCKWWFPLPPPVFLRCWFHQKPKVGRLKLLLAITAPGLDVWSIPLVGGGGHWLMGFYKRSGRVHANKQTRSKPTCLISWKSAGNENLIVWLSTRQNHCFIKSF